jgi:hypothetical protein
MWQPLTFFKKHAKAIDIVFAMVLCSIVIWTYRGLVHTYFRQDEWASLGQVLSSGPFYFFSQLSIPEIVFGKFRPLGSMVNNSFHFLFSFSVMPFVIFGIGIHFLNGFLVYLLAKRFTGSYRIGWIASIIFSCSYSIHQAISWFAAPTTTVAGTLFLLLSLYIYFVHIIEKTKYGMWLSIIFLYIATLFKESNIIGAFMLPVMHFLYTDRKNRHLLRVTYPFALYILLLLVMRVPSLLGAEGKVTGFSTNSSQFIPKLIVHAVSYPIEAFAQQFIPQQILFRVSAWYQTLNYSFLSSTTMQSAILENITSDLISLSSSLYLFIVVCIGMFTVPKVRTFIVFGVLFSLISYVPYSMLDKGSSFLDSRYYYTGMIGGAIALAGIVEGILLYAKHKILLYRILAVVLYIGIGMYAYKQSVFVQRDIRALQFDSSVQAKLLKDIQFLYPTIGFKSVFYITGNRTYYGVENLHVPLQAGPAYVLMVYYYPKGSISETLLRDAYLLDVRHEGYRVVGDKAFGYFSTYESLLASYNKKLFSLQDLRALYYDGAGYEIRDITPSIKEALLSDAAQLH